MICLTLDLNSPDNFDIETIKISFRRLRQSYANDRRLVNAISLEYEPLPDPTCVNVTEYIEFVKPFEVAARLRSFRKPNGLVVGDINPKLVSSFSDILAIPLSVIYNQTLNELTWPKMWKNETVTVIPKNCSPSSLSELRNLSCTPLFSKVLESFVLERLRSEIKLSDRQFGGVKGCETEHFLIETWDAILSSIEDGESAANLLSVDFEKAFNRMDHLQCLYALSDLGASDLSIDWVVSFLHGRTMSVKVYQNLGLYLVAPPRGASWVIFCSVSQLTNLPGLKLIRLFA